MRRRRLEAEKREQMRLIKEQEQELLAKVATKKRKQQEMERAA